MSRWTGSVADTSQLVGPDWHGSRDFNFGSVASSGRLICRHSVAGRLVGPPTDGAQSLELEPSRLRRCCRAVGATRRLGEIGTASRSVKAGQDKHKA